LSAPELDVSTQEKSLRFTPKGEWVASTVGRLESAIDRQADAVRSGNAVTFDLSHLKRMDTAGVWLIQRTVDALVERGIKVTLEGQNKVFNTFAKRLETYKPAERPREMGASFFGGVVQRLGEVCKLSLELLTFLGQVVVTLFRVLLNPKKLRGISVVAHIEEMGVNAIPIITIMAVGLGLVLSFQGADQLKRMGVEIYVINLVSISVVREVGILITAIMIAGRSGSAITAQLGIMKINEEVDALKTLGIDPIEVLVVPRVIALIILMPLLAFIADIGGCIGGALYVIPKMGVSAELYVNRVGEAVTEWSFWIGIIKAPIFGFAIAVVSCFEGLQVRGSAESVGRHTTAAVVESIFIVMIADALLSIFFVEIGV
jgi:phospholipid/cholesterol/gamma-HCH transport system permease protein